jgi:hypothetical protein
MARPIRTLLQCSFPDLQYSSAHIPHPSNYWVQREVDTDQHFIKGINEKWRRFRLAYTIEKKKKEKKLQLNDDV